MTINESRDSLRGISAESATRFQQSIKNPVIPKVALGVRARAIRPTWSLLIPVSIAFLSYGVLAMVYGRPFGPYLTIIGLALLPVTWYFRRRSKKRKSQ